MKSTNTARDRKMGNDYVHEYRHDWKSEYPGKVVRKKPDRIRKACGLIESPRGN